MPAGCYPVAPYRAIQMLKLLRCGNYYRGRGGLSHREAKKKPATPKRSGRSEQSEFSEP
jgi:hypothetical protein